MTMKALLIDDGHRLYLGEADKPGFADHELLVKVKATTVNRADLYQKQGLYPPPEGASTVLGLDMSGVIEEVGASVTGWNKGDRVCALLPGGGYAEYVSIPAGMAIPIPETLSFDEAAAIPEAFLSAYLPMFWLAQLKKGESVLIHAGASGVGTAAIQLARELGAKVIATAGTEEKRQLCLSLGADVAIDYKDGPFAPQVNEATGGAGVNVVFDFIGAPYWEQNIDSLTVNGKLILFDAMGGSTVHSMDIDQLFNKQLQVLTTALRSQPLEAKIALTKDFMAFAFRRFEKGALRPILDSTWDWTEANDAHARMEGNKNAGKIVLRMTADHQ